MLGSINLKRNVSIMLVHSPLPNIKIEISVWIISWGLQFLLFESLDTVFIHKCSYRSHLTNLLRTLRGWILHGLLVILF